MEVSESSDCGIILAVSRRAATGFTERKYKLVLTARSILADAAKSGTGGPRPRKRLPN